MEISRIIKTSNQSQILRPSGKEAIPLGSGVISKLLGDGGMASVYEIWNSQLEVYRAVKLLHPNCNKEALERFQTEIKITAKMHHPYIIEIHGVGKWNDLPYIEMEKADGVSLDQLIHTRGAFPVDVCLAIGTMVSKALEYAHNHTYIIYNKEYKGVIHRDLKPGNIMVCKDGVVKLMDFGIARPTEASFHTIDGSVIGTLQYLSPEQLEGSELDIRTDLYSLGVCLYEMSCGHLAFPENNLTRLLSDKSKNLYIPLSQYDLHLPSKYIDIVSQCMHHEKTCRVQTASLLSTELTKLLHKSTFDPPEQIVKNYFASSFQGRILPSIQTKKKIKSNTKILMGCVIIALLYSLLMLFIKTPSKDNAAVSKQITQPLPSDSIKTQAIVTKGIDSVNTSEDTKSQSVATTVTTKDSSRITKKPSATLSNSNVKKVTKVPLQPQPAASLVSAVNKSENTIQNFKLKYDTEDLLIIAQKELQQKNYSDVLLLLSILDKDQKNSIISKVLKARALDQSDRKAYISYIKSLDVNEAELLFAKASLLSETGSISEVEQLLEKAAVAPRALISSETIAGRVYYLKAVCATKRFDQHPDETTWKAAIGAWYIVKKEMRSQPDHIYYKKADGEIIRIGEKYRSIKG